MHKPDHRAVVEKMYEEYSKGKPTAPGFTFDIWLGEQGLKLTSTSRPVRGGVIVIYHLEAYNPEDLTLALLKYA